MPRHALCACNLRRARLQFADGEYHTYAFEWHTGDADCSPRVDFFFDGEVRRGRCERERERER